MYWLDACLLVVNVRLNFVWKGPVGRYIGTQLFKIPVIVFEPEISLGRLFIDPLFRVYYHEPW